MSENTQRPAEPLKIFKSQAERIAKQIIKQEAMIVDGGKKLKYARLDIEPSFTEFEVKSVLEGIHQKTNKRGW